MNTNNNNNNNKSQPTAKRNVYNPVAQFKNAEEKEAARVVWCSESVKLAYEAVDQGLPLRSNPWFFGNIALRKPGLLYRYTDIELREWLRCKYDILYYANTYAQILTPAGTRMHFTLRPYQRKMLRAYQKNKYVIVLTGRQIGKTVVTAIFLSWAVTFNRELNIAVLGDRLATSSENLSKTKDILNSLPFFMKPGVFVWNGGMVAFDNGCKIITGTAQKSSLVGKTIHILYLDELAIPPAQQSKTLVDYALPTIASLPTGKCIITSTPSGENVFKTLWVGAINGTNGFYPIQVNWWDIPGRDDKWKAEQISILGEDAFNEQYNCVFLSGASSIFASHAIDAIARRLSNYVHIDDDVLNNILRFLVTDPEVKATEPEPHTFMQWHKNADTKSFKDLCVVITIDIAEGLDGDYSVMHFHKLIDTSEATTEEYDASTLYDMFDDDKKSLFMQAVDMQQRLFAEQHKMQTQLTEQSDDDYDDDDDYYDTGDDEVGTDVYETYANIAAEEFGLWRSNVTSIKVMALYLQFIVNYLFDPNKVKIVYERNKYGGEFKSYCLTERARNVALEEEHFAYFPRTLGSDSMVPGISITPGTKPIYVRQLKDCIESGKILENNAETQRELTYFGAIKGKHTTHYAAAPGFHDDITMTLVHLAAFMDIRNSDWLSLLEVFYNGVSDYDEDDD